MLPSLLGILLLVNVHISASPRIICKADSALAPEVKKIIETVIRASSDFDIDAIANLYTPNAVVVDEEAPYSWNGPTAGVQWVYVVKKTVKDLKLSHFRASLERIKFYQQNGDMVYVVAPATYTGMSGNDPFEERGAFTFVLRKAGDQWLIKSQAWLPERGM